MDPRAAEGFREHPDGTQAGRSPSIQGLNKVINPPQAGHGPRTHSPRTSGRDPGWHKRNKSPKAIAPAEPESWDDLKVGGGVVPEDAKRIMRGETGQIKKKTAKNSIGVPPLGPEGMLSTRHGRWETKGVQKYHGLTMTVEMGRSAHQTREVDEGCLDIKRGHSELDGGQQWHHHKMGPSGTTKVWEMVVVQNLNISPRWFWPWTLPLGEKAEDERGKAFPQRTGRWTLPEKRLEKIPLNRMDTHRTDVCADRTNWLCRPDGYLMNFRSLDSRTYTAADELSPNCCCCLDNLELTSCIDWNAIPEKKTIQRINILPSVRPVRYLFQCGSSYSGVLSGALGKVSQTEAEVVTVVVRTIGLWLGVLSPQTRLC